MASNTFHFIQVGADNGGQDGRKTVNIGPDSGKLVRSVAMRHYRAKQREAGQEDTIIQSSPTADGDTAWRAHRANRRAKSSQKLTKLSSADKRSDREAAAGKTTTPLDAVSLTGLQSAIEEYETDTKDPLPMVKLLAHLQARNRAFASAWVTPNVHSPDMFRIRQMGVWIETFFPGDASRSPVMAKILGHWFYPKAESMRLSNDSVGLLTTGSAKSDIRILTEGRRRHVAAIEHLRHDLGKPAVSKHAVIASALNLLLCEIFDTVSSGVEAWVKHIAGMKAILVAFAHFGDADDFAPIILNQLRLTNLIFSLTTRRSMPLGEDYWCQGPLPPSGGADDLMRLGVRLPALLEAADQIAACKTPDRASATRTWLLLLNLEKALEGWHANFAPLYAAVCSTFRSKKAILADQKSPTDPDNPLGLVCYVEAVVLSFYWCLVLLLREALLIIKPALPFAAPKRRCLTAETDECAHLLRQAFPYLSKSAGPPVSKALAVRAPLHFVGRWYRRSKSEAGLQWCREQESQLREEVSYLNWDGLLPFAFLPVVWLM